MWGIKLTEEYVRQITGKEFFPINEEELSEQSVILFCEKNDIDFNSLNEEQINEIKKFLRKLGLGAAGAALACMGASCDVPKAKDSERTPISAASSRYDPSIKGPSGGGPAPDPVKIGKNRLLKSGVVGEDGKLYSTDSRVIMPTKKGGKPVPIK